MAAKSLTAKKAAPAKKDVFVYANPFPKGHDDTKYRLVAGPKGYVKKAKFAGKPMLVVDPKALTVLAHEAMRDVSFLLRPKHQQQVASILQDPAASPNDRFMATALLKNAVVSAQFELPFCQDTGPPRSSRGRASRCGRAPTTPRRSRRGSGRRTRARTSGIRRRPLSTCTTRSTRENNLPAQIDIYATPGMQYKLLFVTKGGGSANKSALYQETKALLNPRASRSSSSRR